MDDFHCSSFCFVACLVSTGCPHYEESLLRATVSGATVCGPYGQLNLALARLAVLPCFRSLSADTPFSLLIFIACGVSFSCKALEIAARNVEQHYTVKLSRKFEIEFFGLYRSGDIIDIETTIERIYLGKGQFYPIIDVAVMKANPEITTIRLVVSGHEAVPTFEQTWNDPPGSGPFKQMLFLQFKFASDPNDQA
jgi:hypothetical protein